MNTEQATSEGEQIARACWPLFAGKGALAQAAALADLFGTFLSAFPDDKRCEMIDRHGDVALRIARLYDSEKGRP